MKRTTNAITQYAEIILNEIEKLRKVREHVLGREYIFLKIPD